MPVLPLQRRLFEIPDEIAYFNCAYNAPQLIASKTALQAGAAAKCRPWERTARDFFDDAERVRVLASKALGGKPDNWAIVPAASYGLSAAARAVEPELKKGDVILVMDEAFPSNYLPWARTAQVSGATLRTVPTPANGDWTQAVLERITPEVKVVAVDNCHWTNGALFDLSTIGARCREIGAILAVDATQSLGAMPFDFEAIKPDFVAAAGYKWLLSPYGFGLLYAGEQRQNARPLEESWLARDNAENFAGLVNYSDRYLPGARRFDAGEKNTATLLPGAIAALEQIGAWGVTNIAASLLAINRQIADRLEKLGFALPDQRLRAPHLFGAKLPEGYSGDLIAALQKEGIYVSRRGSSLRFAPHLHVSDHDVQRLLETIETEVKS